MSNAAKKLPPDGGVPPAATPDSVAREKLTSQLQNRLIDMGADIGAGSSATSKTVLRRAARLAQVMIGYAKPLPASLNIASQPDGDVLVTLFGMIDRKVDLWVTDESGDFVCVKSERGTVFPEETYRIEDCWKVARWLLANP